MMRFLTIIAATVAAVLTLGSAAQASGPEASSAASAPR